jgi:FkbH-like protein
MSRSSDPVAHGPEPARRLREWKDALATEFRIDRYTHTAREIESGIPREAWPPIRILVVGSFTIENVEPLLRVWCYLEEISPRIHFAPAGQLEQALLAVTEPWDLVIVAARAEDLAPILFERFLDPGVVRAAVAAELRERIERVAVLAHERTGGAVLFHNFVVPTERVFGILDPRIEDTPTSTVRGLNEHLATLSRLHPFLHVVDVERLAALHGKAEWCDPRFWYTGKLGLVNRPARMVVDEWMRFIRSMRGKVSKCLVLDCDNTLWGGTVGEDGIANIRLGGDYPGACYLDLQREVLKLFHRGVLIALNSKNDEADVLEVLDRHPAMLLRRSHIAAFRINWQDKATNLREIAGELGLGLDSLVYVDDERAEVELVRRTLPEVEAIHLGGAPAHLVQRFHQMVRFDLLSITDEDRARSRMYQEQGLREDLKGAVSSLDEFYEQLQMRARIRRVSDADIPRASQLSQRTNQFNLTTRRYSEADIARLTRSDGHRLFVVDLADKFGDYGTVGLLILAPHDGDTLTIDTLLLSCRVIGRTLEQTLLAHALDVARAAGCRALRGQFVPTRKNGLVQGLYEAAGFAKVDADGRVWERQCVDRLPYSAWIHLEDEVALPAGPAGRTHGR